jgi:hypothetical protein
MTKLHAVTEKTQDSSIVDADLREVIIWQHRSSITIIYILYHIMDDSSYRLNFDLDKKNKIHASPQLERAC